MAKHFAKTDKTGRTQSGDKFARLFLATMQCPAWRGLSPYAQRLYPWVLLEWKGPRANNNGHISFSTRQAAAALGCNSETARKAFQNLQAKGFLVVARCAGPGTAGKVRGHEYEITELGAPASPIPRKLFRDWKPGCDFPVVKAKSNNPRGIGGAQNLETELTDGASNSRTELTDGACPNLHRKTDGAKNTDYRTYGVSHPYLPEGGGAAEGDSRRPSRRLGGCLTGDAVRGSGEKTIESKIFAELIGEPRSFVVLRSGIPIRVGVRTTMRRNAEACS